MELCYKPDLAEAQERWRAFWQHEIIKRPCVKVTAPIEGKPRKAVPYMAGFRDGGTYPDAFRAFDEWAAATYFAGEAIPFFELSFGPDQFSGFLGAELVMAEDRATSWAVRCVADWRAAPLELRKDNPLWSAMLDCMRTGQGLSEGKYLLTVLDLHSHLDCLGALRGAEALCLDLIDRPAEIEAMLERVRALYAPMYEALYEAGGMARRGSIGWAPFYSEGRFATIQCDYICLISPRQARRFALPAIEDEAAYLDHCVYHLDGPGALVHLDDLLAIPDIDVIQWVPGDGNRPMIQWMDLLKRIQTAGKGLQIPATVEEVKLYHRELQPEGVLYCVDAASVAEADELLKWLERNT
jgi:hypothetical protein